MMYTRKKWNIRQRRMTFYEYMKTIRDLIPLVDRQFYHLPQTLPYDQLLRFVVYKHRLSPFVYELVPSPTPPSFDWQRTLQIIREKLRLHYTEDPTYIFCNDTVIQIRQRISARQIFFDLLIAYLFILLIFLYFH